MKRSPRRHKVRSNTHKSKLRLGTRGSALALFQSRLIARLLKKAHPGLQVELVEISTTGDVQTNKTLKSFGGTGVFVKELELALLDDRIDLAVHSLKDMPTASPKGLMLAAVVGREQTNDVAIIGDGLRLEDLPDGAVIGSGSERRRAQIKAHYPHLRFAEIRGNVDTRLRKVAEGQYSGTILAMAGLRRLKLLKKSMQILPLEKVLPAPGQGAIGIECRSKDAHTRRLLAKINNEQVQVCTSAERLLLARLGGGCNLPLGALCTVEREGRSEHLWLRAFLGLADGSRAATVNVHCEQRKNVSPAVLAKRIANLAYVELLQRGAEGIIQRLQSSSPVKAEVLT
jgi:hydroxymethylbilane synthase